MVQMYNEILLSSKKGTKHQYIQQQHEQTSKALPCVEQKTLDVKELILHDSTYVKFKNRHI